MKKETYYFSHDANSQDDPKIMLLIDALGLEGYGIFWAIIERLRCEKEYKLPLFVLPSLARRWGTSKEKVEAVVLKFNLFLVIDDLFFSDRLCRSMQLKSENASKNALARWHKPAENKQVNTGAMQPHTVAMQNDAIKEKKSKVKESKELIINKEVYKSFSHLKIYIDEVEKLKNIGYSENQINNVLDSIQNYKKNTNYTSLYLTAKKWLEKETTEKKDGALIHNLKQNQRLLNDLNNF